MMGDTLLMQAQFPNMLGNITSTNTYPSEYVGNMFIAAGMGVRSISTKELIFFNGSRQEVSLKEEQIGYTKRKYEEYRDFVTDYVKTLPSHYEFLKNEIYGGKDDHAI
jgi:hypothetical protein